MDRHLNIDGLVNARDLGGLPTKDGRTVRKGAVVRTEALTRVTDAGWAALVDHGVRTVIDLRGDDELERNPAIAQSPDQVRRLHLPLDDLSDTEFWDEWQALSATPLYYRPFLKRYPATVARIIGAIADAEQGGVLIHCAGGRDRTGLISALLLAFAGVSADDIATDYRLSDERLVTLFSVLGIEDPSQVIASTLAERGTNAHAEMMAIVDSLDVPHYLADAGLTEPQLAALRHRLVSP
ncbi:tyrosine-protein phosphatase [Herbihabitans rhizosphaerae]|uniref:tyrosine-protein phosphatase n=1 Tax=Herbihabitans rhizosphaerae TaxID=1872711 RepID=UPI001F5E6B41|nr:tyrosine-protein phosphatase [Herbihabitans rhizosphaerae]